MRLLQILALYKVLLLCVWNCLQYSNVYVVTSDLPKLVEDPNLQAECMQYVARPGTLYVAWRQTNGKQNVIENLYHILLGEKNNTKR